MSEASIRYERQVDGSNCANVAEIAAALFEECCGAEVCPGIVDVYPGEADDAPARIEFRPYRARALAGAPITNSFMMSRLERLGCTVEKNDIEHYVVTAPTNRPDLTREVDLIEEVVRLWGEGDIEATLPAARNHAGGLTVEQRRIRKIGAGPALLRPLGDLHVQLRRSGRSRSSGHPRDRPRRAREDHPPARGRAVRDAPLHAAGAASLRGVQPRPRRRQRRALRDRPRLLWPREPEPPRRAELRLRRHGRQARRRRVEPAL